MAATNLWRSIDQSGNSQETTAAGAIDVTIRPLGWRMWWGSPFMSTKAVAGSAPL
ncbi:hypothetical protein [Nocardia sp. CA-119907]|uniref:hypothetical protein n=1 Tax=Nocardia sp. CA-119907 TaxID=3239973 RepID=UPI003D95521C